MATHPVDEPIAALLRGARSFREREYGAGGGTMRKLAAGQQPRAMVIACADSRVDPALLFDARPGELLVVRSVANLVPPPDSGAIATGILAAVELGVTTLGIPHLIVCGHSGCAGIGAALDAVLHPCETAPSHLRDWAAAAAPACREVIDEPGKHSTQELPRRAEQRAVLNSLENLRALPWLREREAGGALALHGWWFEIATGQLWIADPKTRTFNPLPS